MMHSAMRAFTESTSTTSSRLHYVLASSISSIAGPMPKTQSVYGKRAVPVLPAFQMYNTAQSSEFTGEGQLSDQAARLWRLLRLRRSSVTLTSLD